MSKASLAAKEKYDAVINNPTRRDSSCKLIHHTSRNTGCLSYLPIGPSVWLRCCGREKKTKLRISSARGR